MRGRGYGERGYFCMAEGTICLSAQECLSLFQAEAILLATSLIGRLINYNYNSGFSRPSNGGPHSFGSV